MCFYLQTASENTAGRSTGGSYQNPNLPYYGQQNLQRFMDDFQANPDRYVRDNDSNRNNGNSGNNGRRNEPSDAEKQAYFANVMANMGNQGHRR